MNEFDLIKKYFARAYPHRDDVIRGIGDDAALVNVPQGIELAITTDTLISGIHFLENTLPYDIGYKALAVNLSDLAAMGATPRWITLAITLPEPNEPWIQAFCNGLFTLANHHQVQLIGGDLTHGPLSITIQAMGWIPSGKALLRSGAKPADLIYVTGTLGDAGLALRYLQKQIHLEKAHQVDLISKLNRPEPRILVGESLREIAHSAIDISDGLAADLGHILEESQVGAVLYVDQLPLSPAMQHTLSPEQAIQFALTAGDDYELCFTVPIEKQTLLEKTLASISCSYTCVGKITSEPELNLCYQDGKKYHGTLHGYQHF